MRERVAAEARWRGLVSEQVESGKSVAAFCRERGVPASQMFSWKKRFRELASSHFVEVSLRPAQMVAVPAARSSAIEVRLSRGRSLLVEPGFDASHLRALLSVLDGSASDDCMLSASFESQA
jgi:transposase-like protein